MANYKGDSYNSIFIIVNQLTKMDNCKCVKVIIDVSSLAKIILDVVVEYYGILVSIVTNISLFFTSKF